MFFLIRRLIRYIKGRNAQEAFGLTANVKR